MAGTLAPSGAVSLVDALASKRRHAISDRVGARDLSAMAVHARGEN